MQWKAECWTILKGVSLMEALWEGNGISENVRECWRRIREKFYVTATPKLGK